MFQDREDWVCAIEQQILTSLQGQESTKQKVSCLSQYHNANKNSHQQIIM